MRGTSSEVDCVFCLFVVVTKFSSDTKKRAMSSKCVLYRHTKYFSLFHNLKCNVRRMRMPTLFFLSTGRVSYPTINV